MNTKTKLITAELAAEISEKPENKENQIQFINAEIERAAENGLSMITITGVLSTSIVAELMKNGFIVTRNNQETVIRWKHQPDIIRWEQSFEA
jgi:hypothetical protein